MSRMTGAPDKVPKCLIRVYREYDRGFVDDRRETLDLAEFCGVVPRVGDRIVSPYIRDKHLDIEPWKRRSIWTVTAVYWRPDMRIKEDDASWVVLVVKERPMEEGEQELA